MRDPFAAVADSSCRVYLSFVARIFRDGVGEGHRNNNENITRGHEIICAIMVYAYNICQLLKD